MTPYRERLNAGEYSPKKPKKQTAEKTGYMQKQQDATAPKKAASA